jgi:hypothetical protein
MDGGTVMKLRYIYFSMFAVLIFLTAPCASAMQTTTIERTLDLLPPNPDSYQALFNMADANNSQYSNANISVDPFCDASGIDGVRLSSMMLPSIVKHTNSVVVSGLITAKFDLPSGYIFRIGGSDVYVSKQDYDWYQVNETYERYANDNTDFRIVTFHKFMSSEIMSGASESWWRIPYYYNINDASQQFNLNFYLYKITNPGKVNFTYYPATNRIIPKPEYQPSQIYAKTFTDIGFHNDDTSWYTQTNIVVPNQITDTTYNQSYQFCWVNITAPIYANVSYCVVWHISHTAVENVYGLPGGMYSTASDLCKDNFYRTMTWYNNFFQDFNFDADVSIVFSTGMAGSTTGFRIAPPSYVKTDVDINPSMEKHAYSLYPNGYATTYYEEPFDSLSGWSTITNPPNINSFATASGGALCTQSASSVFNNEAYAYRSGWGIFNNKYTVWTQYVPRTQDGINGCGFIYINMNGYASMWIRLYEHTIEVAGKNGALISFVPAKNPSGVGIYDPNHINNMAYYYVFRMELGNNRGISIYRNLGGIIPHQTSEHLVAKVDVNVLGVGYALPIGLSTDISIGAMHFGIGSGTHQRADFSHIAMSNTDVKDGCDMYQWGAKGIDPYVWDTTTKWTYHNSEPTTGITSYDGYHHLQLDDVVNAGTQRETWTSYPKDGVHPSVGEAIGWSMWFTMQNPNGYGNTIWYNTSEFIAFAILGYNGAFHLLAYEGYNANNDDFYKYVSLTGIVDSNSYTSFYFVIYVEPYRMNPSSSPGGVVTPTTAWNGKPLIMAFDKSTIVYASEINEYTFDVKMDVSKKTLSNYLTIMIPFRYTTTPTIAPLITVAFYDSNNWMPNPVWVSDGTQFHTDFVLMSIPSNQISGTIKYCEITIQSFCEAYMFMYDYNNKFDLMDTNHGTGANPNTYIEWNTMLIYQNGILVNHIGYQPYRSVQFTDGQWVNTIDSITTQYITLVRVHFYKFNMDEPVLMYIAGYETTNLTAFKIQMGKFGEVYEAEEWYAMVRSRSKSFIHSMYEVGKFIYNGLKWIWNMIGSFIDMVISFVVPLIEDIYYAIVNLCAFALAVLGFVMVTFIMLNFVNIWLLLPTQPIDVTIQHIHSSAKSYIGMAKSALSGVSGVANIMSSRMFKGKQGGGSE